MLLRTFDWQWEVDIFVEEAVSEWSLKGHQNTRYPWSTYSLIVVLIYFHYSNKMKKLLTDKQQNKDVLTSKVHKRLDGKHLFNERSSIHRTSSKHCGCSCGWKFSCLFLLRIKNWIPFWLQFIWKWDKKVFLFIILEEETYLCQLNCY